MKQPNVKCISCCYRGFDLDASDYLHHPVCEVDKTRIDGFTLERGDCDFYFRAAWVDG